MRTLKKHLTKPLIVVAVLSAYLLGAYIDQQDEVVVNTATYHQQ